MARMIVLLLISLVLAIPASAGEVKVVVTPTRGLSAKAALGSQYRVDHTAAVTAIHRRDFAKAASLLESIMSYCDSLQRPGLTLVSVGENGEYDRYMRERGGDTPVEWVDMVCPSAYKTSAFLLIEQGADLTAALSRLAKAAELAPYWPDPHVERGFILAHTGQLQEGMASYQRAIALAEEHPSSASDKAIAYRGLGYVLVELQNWEAAEAAYRKSLELEPDSEVALHELEFIRTNRPQTGKGPTFSAASTP